MKRVLKQLVVGMPWERPLRRVQHALTGNRGALYDAQTIEVIRRVLRPDSNAIDAGAFEGGILRHIVRQAPRGTHLAFEPLPDRYQALVDAFPRVRVHPVALGDQPGAMDYFRVRRFPALSGLRRHPAFPAGEDVETVRVTVETLDRVVPREMPVAFVKVDVEGGELGLFRGAAATLARTLPVVVFESGSAAAGFGATPDAIHDSLADPGLRVSTLDAWLAGRPALSRGGFRDLFESGKEFYFIAHP